MTKVKMCGLSRPIDIEMANELKPDYIGFVFYKKSKRYIDFDKAASLKSLLDSNIKAVAVFIDVELEEIKYLAENDIVDVIQLHGPQDNDFISEIRKFTDKPIYKAFSIKSEDDILKIEQSKADMVLIDSPVAGSGKTFDWSLLKSVKRDYFLAGGLNKDNVIEAMKTLKPYGVDVSSGIETDNLKDYMKAKEFITIVRKEDDNE